MIPGLVKRAEFWMWVVLVFFAAYPAAGDKVLGFQFIPLFIYAILALGLNVVVGYTGLFHLGIAAFFGIGAYITGIVTVRTFPFQYSFLVAVPLAVLGATLFGILLSGPLLRLRGDYLALVTLGFGQIVIYAIRNLEAITAGTQGLTPILPPLLPESLEGTTKRLGIEATWRAYPIFYYLCLGLLVLVLLLLRNLERSRLGRAWVAIREDELAAASMGLNPARLKLWAFALDSGLAGLAGCLYAVALKSTAGPQAYDFNRSVITLVCVVLGGIASRPGVLLGVFLIIGYDNVLTPILDNELQRSGINPEGKQYLRLTGWRLFIFGMALILITRFRPEGLIPAQRGEERAAPKGGA
jgi:branched-chain amino acid transport system permease protein